MFSLLNIRNIALAALVLLASLTPASATDPDLLGYLPTFTNTYVEVVGSHAYASSRTDVEILDVSNPAQPTPVGSILTLPPSTFVRGLEEGMGRLYVSLQDYGFQEYDLSTPQNPSPRGDVTLPDIAGRMLADGTRLYVLDNVAGLLIYDISGVAPVLLGSRALNAPAEPFDLWVDGTTVYLSQLRLINVSDVFFYVYDLVEIDATNAASPAAPITLIADEIYPTSVRYASGDTLYVYSGQTNPETRHYQRSTMTLLETWDDAAWTIFPATGGFILHATEGVAFANATNILSNLPLEGLHGHADLEGSHLYWPAGTQGLRIVDVSDPLQAQVVGNYRRPSSNHDVLTKVPGVDFVSGDNLSAVDISDPMNPSVVWAFEKECYAMALDAGREMLHVRFGAEKLVRTFDVSTPTVPVLVNEEDIGTGFDDIEVADGKLYVIGFNRLDIYDAANPSSGLPFLGFINGVGAGTVCIQDSTAYLLDDVDGHVVNVADATNPTLVTSFALANAIGARDVAVVGNLLVGTGWRMNPPAILSLADPMAPVPVAWSLPGNPLGGGRVMDIEGDLLALPGRLSHIDSRIWIYDMSTLPTPTLEATYLPELSSYVYGAGLRESTVTMVGFEYALFGLRLQSVVSAPPELAGMVEISGAVPNPFNPSTRIEFTVPAGVIARLDILDLRGRRVAALGEQVGLGELQSVLWQPRDLASGVYLVRLRTGELESVRKITLVQ